MKSPRIIRRVVCGYRLDSLPGEWLQAWRRLDRAMQRAGLNVKVSLDPLDDLPSDADILVVPPELENEAGAVAPPGVGLIVTSPTEATATFARLVESLAAGREITADRIVAADPTEPRIVTYRGSIPID